MAEAAVTPRGRIAAPSIMAPQPTPSQPSSSTSGAWALLHDEFHQRRRQQRSVLLAPAATPPHVAVRIRRDVPSPYYAVRRDDGSTPRLIDGLVSSPDSTPLAPPPPPGYRRVRDEVGGDDDCPAVSAGGYHLVKDEVAEDADMAPQRTEEVCSAIPQQCKATRATILSRLLPRRGKDFVSDSAAGVAGLAEEEESDSRRPQWVSPVRQHSEGRNRSDGSTGMSILQFASRRVPPAPPEHLHPLLVPCFLRAWDSSRSRLMHRIHEEFNAFLIAVLHRTQAIELWEQAIAAKRAVVQNAIKIRVAVYRTCAVLLSASEAHRKRSASMADAAVRWVVPLTEAVTPVPGLRYKRQQPASSSSSGGVTAPVAGTAASDRVTSLLRDARCPVRISQRKGVGASLSSIHPVKAAAVAECDVPSSSAATRGASLRKDVASAERRPTGTEEEQVPHTVGGDEAATSEMHHDEEGEPHENEKEVSAADSSDVTISLLEDDVDE